MIQVRKPTKVEYLVSLLVLEVAKYANKPYRILSMFTLPEPRLILGFRKLLPASTHPLLGYFTTTVAE